MSLLASILAVLRDRSVPHAVIGATALAFHGVARSTSDLDLFATQAVCLTPATWRPVVEAGYAVEVRRGDDSDPLAGVVRFESRGESPVDLVVGKRAWQAELLARAEVRTLLGVEIPVVRAADLILLKLYAGGPQDRWDIAQLLATATPRELAAEVESVLPAECRDLWGQILIESAGT